MVMLALGQTVNLSRVDFACRPMVAKISIRKDGVQTLTLTFATCKTSLIFCN